jgi:hypothetical protein
MRRMTPEDEKTTPPESTSPGQHKRERGSGEGAGTALDALIRKRRQAELPEPPETAPPAPPGV